MRIAWRGRCEEAVLGGGCLFGRGSRIEGCGGTEPGLSLRTPVALRLAPLVNHSTLALRHWPMAGYKGHITGATVFGGGYLAFLAYVFSVDAAYRQFTVLEQVGYPLMLLTLSLLFGLWPDVDTDSKGQEVFYSIFFVVDLFLVVTEQFRAAAYLGLVAVLLVLSRHRGWTHTWWAMLLVPSPLLILPYMHVPERPLVGLPFYGAAVVGYLSHLVVDRVW